MFDLSKEELSVQQAAIGTITTRNTHDYVALQEELSKYKFKPEALREFIKDKHTLLPSEILRILQDKRINEDMRSPKIDRPVEFYAKKPEGAHYGRIVKKKLLPDDDAKKEKYKTRWLEKLGHSGNMTNSVDDVFCEYIGTHLMREILGPERAPKLRLYIQEGEVKIMSRYLKNFQTIHDSEKYGLGDKNLEINGFALFFIVNAMLGDYDMNHGNAGATIIDGKPFWARIDNDSAFSYFTSNGGKPIINQDYTSNFKERMLKDPIYKAEMFNNFNYACELSESLACIDIENLRTVIRIGIEHLSSIYGPDFLENDQVKQALAHRMGILESEINLADIQERIIQNASIIKEQLSRMSSKQISSIFPLHSEIALEEYLAAKTPYGINAKRFFNQLKIRGIDIRNNSHFNRNLAIRSFSLPENEVSSQDFLAQGIIYPIIQDTNSSNLDRIYATELAIKLNMPKLATALIEKGFKSNVKNYEGKTLLHYAVEKGNNTIISALLFKGENPNILDIQGRSPLYSAVEKNDIFTVKLLLENGAIAFIPDKTRSIPIMSAAEKGNIEIVSELLKHPFNIDITERDDGRTTLFLAAKNGHAEVAWKLLERGADPNIRDEEGQTAKDANPELFKDEVILKLFQKAIKRNDTDVIENLLQHHQHLKEIVSQYIDQNTHPDIKALITERRASVRRPLSDISNTTGGRGVH